MRFPLVVNQSSDVRYVDCFRAKGQAMVGLEKLSDCEILSELTALHMEQIYLL
jgi:hypothetical protein